MYTVIILLLNTPLSYFRRLTMSARHYMAGKVGARVSLKAKYELYRNILQQEVGFFDETKSGRFLNYNNRWSDGSKIVKHKPTFENGTIET